MIGSFRGAPCTKLSRSKTAKEMESLMELSKVLLKFVSKTFQKHPFVDVLQNRCPKKFGKFHRKTPVLESPFNKVVDLQLY